MTKLFTARYGETPLALKNFPPARDNQEAKSSNWKGRIPAVTDTKMIVAWNSLMISGLARAYAVFKVPSYLQMAIKAANFILENQFVDGRLHRINYAGKPDIFAQSEDYAFLIKALLDLQSCCSDRQYWLEAAISLQEEFDEFLWSMELGGYYNSTSNTGGELIVRERSYADNATPSANGIAIANLVRLALLTDNLQYLNFAEQGLKAFRSVMSRAPQACPSLLNALDWYHHSTLVRTTEEQINSLLASYFPTVVFANQPELAESSVGLVCQGFKCLPAVDSWEKLLKQVKQSQLREFKI